MSEVAVLTNLDNDGVFTITFNRPEKKNTINHAMWLGLRDAFNEARENDDVTVAILTGTGNDFCAGVDLTDFGGDAEGPHPYDLVVEAVCAFDKPLIAAVKGVGIGGGATVLLHCDVVYVGESVRLRYPFANLGLVTEFAASYMMPIVLGPQRAAELLSQLSGLTLIKLWRWVLPELFFQMMKCSPEHKTRLGKLLNGLFLRCGK